jgi:hypothetical protein
LNKLAYIFNRLRERKLLTNHRKFSNYNHENFAFQDQIPEEDEEFNEADESNDFYNDIDVDDENEEFLEAATLKESIEQKKTEEDFGVIEQCYHDLKDTRLDSQRTFNKVEALGERITLLHNIHEMSPQ